MIKVITVCMLMLAGPVASAGILFEPYVSVPYGEWKQERSATAYELSAKGYTVGYGYGGRMAYTFTNIYLGVEYLQSSVEWRYNQFKNSSADNNWLDVNAKHSAMGALLGVKGQSVAFWISYFLQDQLTMDADTNPALSIPQYNGSGVSVGLGVKLFNIFQVNGDIVTGKQIGRAHV